MVADATNSLCTSRVRMCSIHYVPQKVKNKVFGCEQRWLQRRGLAGPVHPVTLSLTYWFAHEVNYTGRNPHQHTPFRLHSNRCEGGLSRALMGVSFYAIEYMSEWVSEWQSDWVRKYVSGWLSGWLRNAVTEKLSNTKTEKLRHKVTNKLSRYQQN